MPWAINVIIDPDKPNVGTAHAVFTDSDGSMFSATGRATMTAANASSFTSQAISARNAWQTRKTTEANAVTTLVGDFGGATPPESASPPTKGNDGSVTIVLPT
jgi:hypothetical protein